MAALESRSPARLIALATITSCRLSLVVLRGLLDRAEEPVTAAQVTGRPSPAKIALDPKRLSQRAGERVTDAPSRTLKRVASFNVSLTFSSVESVRLLTAPPSFDSLYLLSLGYDAIKERKSQKRKEKDADG